ncbi:hypothetical protein GCM10010174_19200 [Kutzneria viridogrisea]|uniref:Glycosyl hydrolase family 30 beta sandwich domain-containing protein n=1 Tax=Kutzneria viridogrisea TaxID=47990 RepID=A0ABR6B7V8_9PSEU|nr:hypothetical protein [Kutzneria viridogrisea]
MRMSTVTGTVLVLSCALAGVARADTAGPDLVTVHADQKTGHIGSIGANTPLWNDHLLDPQVPGLIRRAGIRNLEFNGGGVSDLFHWRDGTLSPDPLAEEHKAHGLDYTGLGSHFSFDQFEQVARRSGATTSVHVNYGTGTAQEAADWVRYANRTQHYGVRDWIVGEEVYLNGGIQNTYPFNVEPDAHADKSPAAYGRAVLDYARAMKAVDPTIRIGVEVIPAREGTALWDWDKTVLSTVGSAADFVDVHSYPFGQQSDFFAGIGLIKPVISTLRGLVDQTAGRATKIVVGETNSATWPAAAQISEQNALYLADDVLTQFESGVESVNWWALHNGGSDTADLGLLSSSSKPFAPYYGMQLLTEAAQPCSDLLATSSSSTGVDAHAVRRPDGSIAVVLINKDQTAAHQVRLDLPRLLPGATVLSTAASSVQSRREPGPVATTRTLPANSLTAVIVRPW